LCEIGKELIPCPDVQPGEKGIAKILCTPDLELGYLDMRGCVFCDVEYAGLVLDEFIDEPCLSNPPPTVEDDKPAPGTLPFTLKKGTLFVAVDEFLIMISTNHD